MYISNSKLVFPENKKFAFTILDDTDDSTVENVKPVYDLLYSLGLITTKTVWPVDCPEGSRIYFAAETLRDKAYLNFVSDLADKGFEIASHGATMESSKRSRTLKGFEELKSIFGSYPKLYCNHGQNRENLYWGINRYHTTPLRVLGALVRKIRSGPVFEGEDTESDYFWGDFCRDNIKFVRGFAFNNINIMSIDKDMPYQLKQTPYVKYWFSTSDAPDADAFKRLVNRKSIDQLERDGGICILSTHLGKGYWSNGKVDEDIQATLKYLSEKNGWFVPTSTILEFLLTIRGGGYLPAHRRWLLEAKQIYDRLAG